MKTTSYFERKLRERGLRREWIREALENEEERQVQSDEHIAVLGWVRERKLYFRVILLPDGETILNAFPDSNFTRKRGRR